MDKDRTTLTVVVTKDEKLMLKQYALQKGKTVSRIVQEWIKEHCK